MPNRLTDRWLELPISIIGRLIWRTARTRSDYHRASGDFHGAIALCAAASAAKNIVLAIAQ